MAPVEEEELTPETVAALKRSSAQFDRGESVSHEEILREFVR
jgi:predicted transcriptional regulator